MPTAPHVAVQPAHDEALDRLWERRARWIRWSVTSVVVALTAVVATLLVWRSQVQDVGGATSDPAASGEARIARPGAAEALEQVRAWDDTRAGAWERGAVVDLARLYTSSSTEGRADVEALQQWVDSGWRLSGVAPRLERVEEVSRSSDRWVVDVVEQIAFPRAERGDRTVTLPSSSTQGRRITFVLRERGWVVSRVRSLPESVLRS